MNTYTGLGRVVSVHRVDNRRRRETGTMAVTLGAITILLASIIRVDSAGLPLIAVLFPFAAGLLAIGASQLIPALRGGDDGEFTVHVGGLVHTQRSRTHRWRWGQITFIRVRRPRTLGSYTWWSRTPTRTVHGTIHLRHGRPVRFDTTTDEVETLIAAVKAQCDPAPPRTLPERTRPLLLTVAAVATFALLPFAFPPVNAIKNPTTLILLIWIVLGCVSTAVIGILRTLRNLWRG